MVLFFILIDKGLTKLKHIGANESRSFWILANTPY